MFVWYACDVVCFFHLVPCADPEGGQGVQTSPEKSQKYRVP